MNYQSVILINMTVLKKTDSGKIKDKQSYQKASDDLLSVKFHFFNCKLSMSVDF